MNNFEHRFFSIEPTPTAVYRCARKIISSEFASIGDRCS